MPKTRKSLGIILGSSIALLACLGFLSFYLWKMRSEPLRDGPLIVYTQPGLSRLERQEFLKRDFKIIRKVKALPLPVLHAFTEQGGSRLLMANPGKEFLATDVIYDSSLPGKRLIFAGVVDGKCFVFYEQGGIGLADILAFFRLTSSNGAEPLWRGYCGPATNIEELSSQVSNGECDQPVPQQMR